MRNAFRLSLLVLSLFLVGALPGAAAAEPPAGGSLIIVTPDGTGWVCLPPPTAEYATLTQIVTDYHTLNGFRYPEIVHERFVNNCVRQPGGTLDGDIEVFESNAAVTLTPEGSDKPVTVNVPVHSEAHTSRQEPDAAQQTLQTTMYKLEGRVEKTGGWDYLAITAGDANDMPSPGFTTLTRLSDGRVAVESQFEINYRIEYRGAPDGPFAGLEGSSEGKVLMRARPAGSGNGCDCCPDGP